ncbi:iron complex transport system ATP-binding protein [Cryobacterium flavum]|uniref:ABC transporter ATP-binding protein n=1 Tax=Cryobacterium flavum TaxID=1424659 RepID=A0A4V3IAL9_9MICO|nr:MULTISPECIES: ABC transporter ATP-binding protein [Cryobacterium]TFB81178.1 ABC transporter ATP-binding protein [Cryobacterium flavum]SDM71919.1 iron complex transport system ATP-binding protein [Cryobacterium flavum]
MTHQLRAEGITLGYDHTPIIDGLDFEVIPGAITVIVGANASGKSTLLKGLSRLIKPDAGQVTLGGRNIAALPGKKVATVVGLLPQQPIAPDGITVADLVGRGRYPHQGWFRQWSSTDDEIVAAAMAATNTEQLAARHLEDLSGGQRQRVWIAMALAQDPEILLLDEPTTFLDVTHQIEVLDLLLERNRQHGTTVVMVLHDLNLAARYADHLVVMRAGKIIATGAPADTLTAEIVRSAFDLEARIVPDPVCGAPMVVPIGRFHGRAADPDPAPADPAPATRSRLHQQV